MMAKFAFYWATSTFAMASKKIWREKVGATLGLKLPEMIIGLGAGGSGKRGMIASFFMARAVEMLLIASMSDDVLMWRKPA